MKVSTDSSPQDYRYEHITDDVVRVIESGTFQPDDHIPSVREMSKQRGVSVITVSTAVTHRRALPIHDDADRR